jgi:hypothetical protein
MLCTTIHGSSERIEARDGRARRKCSASRRMSKMWEDYKIRRSLRMRADFLVTEIDDRMTGQEQERRP